MIVKLNFLLLGFGLVIYFIWHLNHRGLPKGASELMGLSNKQNGELSINLCPTRITKLQFSPNFELFESKMLWQTRNQNEVKKVPNQVEIEKWFGRNCRIKGQAAEALPAPDRLIANFQYVDGTEIPLYFDSASEKFLFAETTFHSQALQEQFARLTETLGYMVARPSTAD